MNIAQFIVRYSFTHNVAITALLDITRSEFNTRINGMLETQNLNNTEHNYHYK